MPLISNPEGKGCVAEDESKGIWKWSAHVEHSVELHHVNLQSHNKNLTNINVLDA